MPWILGTLLLILFFVSSHGGLLNTAWRVVLNVGDDAAASSNGEYLPLPVSIRFAGDEVIEQVDHLLQRQRPEKLKSLEQLGDAAPLVTVDGEEQVPFSTVAWSENAIDREKSLVTWAVEFPEGAAKGSMRLAPGRVYCSTKLWRAAGLDQKRRALRAMHDSMEDLETALESWSATENLGSLLDGLRDIRRLDERIEAMEERLPEGEVVLVPGQAEELVVAKRGSLTVQRRRHRGAMELLSRFIRGGKDASDRTSSSYAYEQIGTFSLRPLKHEGRGDAD